MMPRPLSWLVALVLPLTAAWTVAAQPARPPAADVLAPLNRAMAAAEDSLRAGELQIAESRYRTAIFDAWMLAGGLRVAGGNLEEARDAFQQASRAVAEAQPALRSLALVHLQLRQPREAVTILTALASRTPGDLPSRKLLAEALSASGQHGEAVQTLEEAHASAPADPEVMFLLAAAYLQADKLEPAARLFDKVAAARPIPQTWVLIGRTYRDFRIFDRARAALNKALAQDPATRRAHYYLGTLAVLSEGDVPLDEAIREFRAELKLAPQDPATNLRLGMALADARQEKAALGPLEAAARLAPSAVAFLYLGRCQLATGRAASAVASLRRSLERAASEGEAASRVTRIHYQLALALRETGSAEANVHFEAAKSGSERQADAERERLARYMNDPADAPPRTASSLALDSPLSGLPAAARDTAAAGVRLALARAYVNLGVMRAQAQQFARAAEFFEQAAAVDPQFPQVHFFLGSAYFNGKQYSKAAAALTRALSADPPAEARRMLALAHFNAGAYRQSAELLANDPQRETDAALQYTYGLALVRSDRAPEAEAVFTRMLAVHGDRAEVHVILGQAHAQQGNFEAAIQALDRARALKPDVADAGATLGLIYLKQGKLTEAAAALRQEIAANPRHALARHTLATVLDLDGRPGDAIPLLRELLEQQPEFADARYLLGKILLSSGDPAQAAPHLEAAVRLSPDDASYHYQLALAYRKLGRAELADVHLARFQLLKDKARGKRP